MTSDWEIKAIHYNQGRSGCVITCERHRTPGFFGSLLGHSLIDETEEIRTINYGRTWFAGFFDLNVDPELLTLARAAYSWMPGPDRSGA